MRSSVLCFVAFCLSAAGAWAGQPTSNNFYPLEKIKPFVSFLGFDRDKQEALDLQTLLQNSGSNWHCIIDSQHLRCPLNGDASSAGSNVYFRAPHMGDNGVMVSEFHVALMTDDRTLLAQLQPEVPAVKLLAEDWSSIILALGKPTNTYDDGSTVQYLYCASRDLPAKPTDPKVARVYVMYVNVSRGLNVVSSVELAVTDQFLAPLTKPTC